MAAISGSRFVMGIQAMYSIAKTQPKDALSFLSKILTIRNSGINFNKSQNSSQDMKTQAGWAGNLQAPPRPASLLMSVKLKMALADFQKNPEMARGKWLLPKSGPDGQAGRAGIKTSS